MITIYERVTRMARDLTATQVYVGSTPITLSNWDHSSGVEHLLDTQRVVGSNPAGPTTSS